MIVTVCWMILLYETRVTNSLWGNHRLVVWTAILAELSSPPPRTHIEGLRVTS